MTTPEEFRSKAEEAEAKAERAQDSSVKQAYLAVARYWREMAEEAEKRK